MDAPNQTLVLYFDPNHKATQQRVRDCLTRLSPGNADRMEALLKSGRVVLKRNANPEKDHRIVELLAETGGICRFENITATGVKAKKSPLRDKEMVCPKCNCSQKVAAECRHCGLIIKKFKKQAPPARPPLPNAQSPSKPDRKLSNPSQRIWKSLKTKHGPSIEKAWKWLKGNPLGDEKIQQWSQRLFDAIFRCIVVSAVALTLEIGLLYLSRVVWFVYISTPVGQVYLAKFGDQAGGIQHLMQSHMALVGWEAVVTALVACVLVGMVAQWFHMIRFFYLPFGFAGHTLLWVIPITGLSAGYLHWKEITHQIGIGCALTLLPSLLLLPCCIHLIQTTVPEIGTLIRMTKGATGGLDPHVNQLKKKIKKWWDEFSRS